MAGPASAVSGEFALIGRLARRFARPHPAVARGIGDDTAVLRLWGDIRLLLTTDLLAQDVHFDLRTATFRDIGYKAAVANLSDIAAMGGVPQAMLVAIAFPPRTAVRQVEQLYQGMMEACRPHGVALIGGDTSSSKQGWFISITMTGTASSRRILYRSGARPGDELWVSGTIGDSLAGLRLLSDGKASALALRHRRRLAGQHRRPTARVALGQALARQGLATAAIDLSDGLSGDLAHLCDESRVGAEVEAPALPVSPALRAYAVATRSSVTDLAVEGGEDYELLFTARPSARGSLLRLSRQLRCPLTRIGLVAARRTGQRMRLADGSLTSMPRLSYEHFRRTRTARVSRPGRTR
jgi:thiamine-monophosphate kinase